MSVRTYYEYPLFDKHELCPTARYVGGTSKYLCEYEFVSKCEGWQTVKKEYKISPVRIW